MESGTRPHKRCRTKPPPAAVTIPDDVLFSNVFLKLPVKSLVRLKAVCRSWRAAVDDPTFVRRHLELSRTKPPSPSLLAIPSKDDMYDEALSEQISFHRLRLGLGPEAAATVETDLMLEKVVTDGIACYILPTHCDGLVAVATATGPVFVCNPATKEFVALPPGSRDVKEDSYVGVDPQAAIGFDPWCNRYVVAKYFYRKFDELFNDDTGEESLDYDIGHEIFTLGGGAGDEWQPTRDPPRPINPGRSPACMRSGAFYWFIYDWLEPCALLRFNLRDETFDVVPSPPGCRARTQDRDHITDLAGELCYVHHKEETWQRETFDVWVAADHLEATPEWSVRYRVDLGVPPSEYRQMHSFISVAAGGDDDEAMLLAVFFEELCMYDVRSKSMVRVVDAQREVRYERRDGSRYTCDPSPTMHYVISYFESLVSIRAQNY